MNAAPVFPPLLTGRGIAGSQDPFLHACALARQGCDGGTVVHNIQADLLRAALVFAPEVPLVEAMAMFPVCGVGLQNALGVLAPPEVAVHLEWNGIIRVNGARCGRMRVAASALDPSAIPDWLVVGFELTLVQTAADPGQTPDVTALFDEGCAEIDAAQILESWARHSLVWINRWSDEGNAPLHAEWIGLVQGVGDRIEQGGYTGTFLGVDERFGMLIRDGGLTRLVPLDALLEKEL